MSNKPAGECWGKSCAGQEAAEKQEGNSRLPSKRRMPWQWGRINSGIYLREVEENGEMAMGGEIRSHKYTWTSCFTRMLRIKARL